MSGRQAKARAPEGRAWAFPGTAAPGAALTGPLRPDLHRRLAGPGHPERDRRRAWDAGKTRILSVLKERARRGDPGLSNEEIRQITHYDRGQLKRLMTELRGEHPEIAAPGSAQYRWMGGK